MITDLKGTILAVNGSFENITGYKESEVLGKNPRVLQSGLQNQTFYQQMWQRILQQGNWHGELWNRRKNGEVYAESLHIVQFQHPDNQQSYYLATFSDITGNKRDLERLQWLESFDQLTGLPNRIQFREKLTERLNGNEPLAIVFISLRRFKLINDAYGHDFGDAVLKSVAARLLGYLGHENLICRWGGDVFALAMHYSEQIDPQIEKLVKCLKQPLFVRREEVVVLPSLGVTLSPHDGDQIDALLSQAETAMNEAKKQLALVSFFAEHQFEFGRASILLERELRKGVELEQFRIHLQPQVLLASREFYGMESLARWYHPERGILGPVHFIPLAEQTGVMDELGESIFIQVCQLINRWQNEGRRAPRVAVNISPVQLQKDDFFERFLAIIDAHRLPLSSLELEFTESMLLPNMERFGQQMEDLRQKGLEISLDDFGTGYSSLSYLKRLPIDTLKIDRSFIQDIVHVEEDRAIVSAMIQMAGKLGVKVIAEGVETKEQEAVLLASGCYAAQGYYYGKPMTVSELERQWLGLQHHGAPNIYEI